MRPPSSVAARRRAAALIFHFPSQNSQFRLSTVDFYTRRA
jgi:hypothetical protein